MDDNEQYDRIGPFDPFEDIMGEYKAAYAALGPEEKMEADVQRALRVIDVCMGGESLSPQLHRLFVEWFLEYGGCRHAGEAFRRYFDRKRAAVGQAPKSGEAMLEEFWKKVEQVKSAKKIFA